MVHASGWVNALSCCLLFALPCLVLATPDDPHAKAGAPGLAVAARQSALDYGKDIGLEILETNVKGITLPQVNESVHVRIPPFGDLGTLQISIADIACTTFRADRPSSSAVIHDNVFTANASLPLVKFTYRWSWKYGFLGGSGEGGVEFVGGQVYTKFTVDGDDKDRVSVHLLDSHLSFVDIHVTADSAHFIENAILTVFHNTILSQLTAKMNELLRSEVPAYANSYLATLPSQVEIQGLPFQAAFRYAVYTHDYVLASAFPTFTLNSQTASRAHSGLLHQVSPGALGQRGPARGGPWTHPHADSSAAVAVATSIAASVGFDPIPSHCKSAQVGRGELAASPEGPAPSQADLALALAHMLAPASWKVRRDMALMAAEEADALLDNADDAQAQERHLVANSVHECPYASSALNVSDADVLDQDGMLTGWVNEAVARCVLLALYRDGQLWLGVSDGDVPGVRLITDLFVVLIPGISRDYPHASMELVLNATAQPEVHFLSGRGAQIQVRFDTRVYVLPRDSSIQARDPSMPGQRLSSYPDDSLGMGAGQAVGGGGSVMGGEKVEVAHLATTVSLVADVQFSRTKLKDMEIGYEVVSSPYTINPCVWEQTLQYALNELQAVWGLERIYRTFVDADVTSVLHAQNVQTRWPLPGWFQANLDLHLDTGGLHRAR